MDARDPDGETGLGVAEFGVRPPFNDLSIGEDRLCVSTDTVELDDRERRMYGRGGGFFDSCGEVGVVTVCSRSKGRLSGPYSSTRRGGGRSTIASKSYRKAPQRRINSIDSC